jgi:hypothetical protein
MNVTENLPGKNLGFDWKLSENTQTAQILMPTNEEPIQIFIIKSGWSKPQLYHVIIEYGDYETTDHRLLTLEQINEIYGVQLTNK